uniref:uncharacterized protein LOC124042759 n=1 Tax=Oncorhynchus gorbuscha TaxID=8017 RepID=UPI001EAF2312|nr:uncharacterized protein LOC124042759 [Oncorhynchus gorbuscha]
MAFGINLWIVLLCSIFSEHLRSDCAPHDARRLRGYMYSGSSQVEDEQKQPGDGYPQDPIKPTFSTSGSVQNDATPRETGPNTHNQELSRRGSASSSVQPAPRMLGLSGSIASRISVSHNKRHTRASITSGQSVTSPSAVKMVSSWEAKPFHYSLVQATLDLFRISWEAIYSKQPPRILWHKVESTSPQGKWLPPLTFKLPHVVLQELHLDQVLCILGLLKVGVQQMRTSPASLNMSSHTRVDMPPPVVVQLLVNMPRV